MSEIRTRKGRPAIGARLAIGRTACQSAKPVMASVNTSPPTAVPPAQARTIVIAVDGPAASGKGTIARALAAHFGLPHMDTGMLYRAVAVSLNRFGGDPAVEFEAVRAVAGLAQVDERRSRTAERIRRIGREPHFGLSRRARGPDRAPARICRPGRRRGARRARRRHGDRARRHRQTVRHRQRRSPRARGGWPSSRRAGRGRIMTTS